MTSTVNLSRLPSTYDNFLFARIGDDAGGTSVSVLSAFARLDRDPWIEAGKLAGMSTDAAIGSLAKTLAIPAEVAKDGSAFPITASRLIGLLTPSPLIVISPQTATTCEMKFSDRLLISCFVVGWLCISLFVA